MATPLATTWTTTTTSGGVAAALGVAVAWAVSSILQARVLETPGVSVGDVQLVTAATFFLGSLALKWAADRGPLPQSLWARPQALGLTVGSGVVGFVVAYRLLLTLLQSTDVSIHRSIALSYVTPLFVSLLAWLVLGRPVTGRGVLGVVLIVVGGIVVGNE